jgi:hypothetical protein
VDEIIGLLVGGPGGQTQPFNLSMGLVALEGGVPLADRSTLEEQERRLLVKRWRALAESIQSRAFTAHRALRYKEARY